MGSGYVEHEVLNPKPLRSIMLELVKLKESLVTFNLTIKLKLGMSGNGSR